jgi:LacI family sucrose operon transcriptional repressor
MPESKTNLLGTWNDTARARLAARLNSAVGAANGAESLLFAELIRRLREADGSGLSPAQAAAEMRLDSAERVPQIAGGLRTKIRDALIEPNPRAYLDTQSYAIYVEKPPPPEWQRGVGVALGLLLADAQDIFVSSLIAGINSVIGSSEFTLVVEVSDESPDTELQKAKTLIDTTLGVMIVPCGNSVLNAEGQLIRSNNVVFVDRKIDLPGIAVVHPDDTMAGRQAARYLIERNCTEIVIVNQGSRNKQDSREQNLHITPLENRIAGCIAEAAKKRVPCLTPDTAGPDEEGGLKTLESLKGKLSNPTKRYGIYALTDRLAIGCMHFLKAAKLSIPIISTEGSPIGDYLDPQLPSIQFDNKRMGQLAAEVLLAKAQGNIPPAGGPDYLIPPRMLTPVGEHHRLPSEIKFP